MAEIIYLREFQEARRRADRRSGDHQNLERAVQLMRNNLAAVAAELRDAAPPEQPELLDRLERLAAMVRYGLGMIGNESAAKPFR
jgi:anti-sigma-K factor RskA